LDDSKQKSLKSFLQSDFLKKNCVDKSELFRLVALNFHLYDEVALLWEEEAIQGVLPPFFSPFIIAWV
jgi:hypothetical protein